MRPDEYWTARVEPYDRWGPFAWYITATRHSENLWRIDREPSRFAWTRRGAERKARRWVRRLGAADERLRRESFVVEGEVVEL